MKVAIVTLPLHTNYGGVLQAFALQRVLEGMGNDVEIIQLREIIPAPKRLEAVRKFLTRSFRKYVLRRRDVEIFRERRINREFPVVGAEFVRFFRKYMNIRYISSFNEIRPSDYDAFVVGSDQVWRPKYNRNLMNSYLDFTHPRFHGVRSVWSREPGDWNVRRVAYAVSFGSDVWEYSSEQTARARILAWSFDELSFREASGADRALRHFGVGSVTVLDPTMLLKVSDYLDIAAEENASANPADGSGCVFEYILDRTPENCSVAHEIERRVAVDSKDGKPLEVNAFLTSDPRGAGDISARVQPSIESWLRGLSSASFVVTDSFHACVFSILFHRPFCVLGNSNRGLSRLEWLLGLFGLRDRLVSTDNAENVDFEALRAVDWEDVDRCLERQRSASLDFLKNSLV